LPEGQATHYVVVLDEAPVGTLSREGIIKGFSNQGGKSGSTRSPTFSHSGRTSCSPWRKPFGKWRAITKR